MSRATGGMLIALALTFVVGSDALAQTRKAVSVQQRNQPRDPIQDVLKNIDPKLLNLSGSELDVEIVGDQLILRGNEEDLNVIELLVAVFKQMEAQKRKELRLLTITEKDANDIASTVGDVIRKILQRPNQRPEDEVVVTALSANILLVAAMPNDIDTVVEIIEAVDAFKEELPPIQQLVFPIKYRRASDVAEQLDEIIKKIQEKKGATGAKGEIQIIANDANNSLIVIAEERERAKIQSLINELDVEPVPGFGEVKLTFFPLLHSKASEMATIITDLLASETDRNAAEETIYRMRISKALPSGEIIELPPIDLQRPTRILADEGTNSLIVATSEENLVAIGELIRLLDGVAVAEEIGIKLFPLQFADAETLRDIISQMFEDSKSLPEDPDGSNAQAVAEGMLGEAVAYNLSLTPDLRTNTLIVAGRHEQLVLVEMIINELDRPATALKFPLRFIQLEHTDAVSIGEIITELFEQRFQALEATNAGAAALERDRVFLTTDIRSNSLIVSASPENYVEIVTLAKQLDTIPAKLFDQIRIIHLDRLNASDIKDKIEELWQRKAELRRTEERFEDIPIIVVDERSNALLVASSMEDYDEIKRLIDVLEAQPLIDDTQLFELKFADAAVLAEMLTQLFEDLAGRSESFVAPTILADPRSNSLIVAATKDGMERAYDLISRLDVESGPLTAIFKVYPLQHASAGQLASRIQELFDSRAEGQEIEGTPIVIMPDEASNALVCSASRDDHVMIVELLSLLDKTSNLAKQFEIFPLKMAKAANVAEKLESLFQSQAEGGSGRMDAIATEADERTNSIIVWASPSQLINIREVIQKMDTSKPVMETTMKVIQLRQALAEDFAELLRKTLIGEDGGSDDERAIIVSWIEKMPDGRERIRKLLKQDIRVEPDTRTNSLLVMAPADSMDMLESMIRDFDSIRPIRSELRLFPLVNSDAEAMVTELEEIFNSDGGTGADGERKSQLVFGGTLGEFDVASVGQELRFSADARTNTLIAAGAEVDLRMVEEFVRYLDSQEAESRITEVIKTKYVEPSVIASAIQGFISQEQDILGDLGDEEAAMRRAERQVSIEAVGGDGEGGQSLIVGMDRKAYQKTMRMIEELDRPEPQVRISVLIAEVTILDTLELGIEIAGQDLRFSENAIVGPNGIIQGSDFDFVGGSTLGAVGSTLGFNFSVVGEDLTFLMHALQQNSRLEILSRPTLLVRNGDEGNITIADQIPFVESTLTSDSGANNSVIGREDVGIVLTATPHISPDGYVTIELVQEISNFSGENLQLTEGVTSPVFNTREVTTNVTIRDGETVMIGGLITTRRSEGENKIPFLGDLPWIGPLFKSTNVSVTQTELVIVMTVDVLRTDDEVRQMSITERDRYNLPDSIRQSPLMEGLRILPEEALMGPTEESGGDEAVKKILAPTPTDIPNQFGPKTRIYGPTIHRAKPTTTTARVSYGPKIEKSKRMGG